MFERKCKNVWGDHLILTPPSGHSAGTEESTHVGLFQIMDQSQELFQCLIQALSPLEI